MPAPPVRFKKRPRKKEQVVPVEEEEEEEVDEDALDDAAAAREAAEDEEDEEDKERVCFGAVTLNEAQAESGWWGRVHARLESNAALAVILTLTFFDMGVSVAGILKALDTTRQIWVVCSRGASLVFFVECYLHLRSHAVVYSFCSFFGDRFNCVDVAVVALDVFTLSLEYGSRGGAGGFAGVASFFRAARALRLLRLLRLLRVARAARALKRRKPLEDLDPLALAEEGDEDFVRFFAPNVAPRKRDRVWDLGLRPGGESVLFVAAKRGHHKLVRAVVRCDSPRAKAAVEARDGVEGMTPLFVAALHHQRRAAHELAVFGRADLAATPTIGPDFKGVTARELVERRGWGPTLDRVAKLEAEDAARELAARMREAKAAARARKAAAREASAAKRAKKARVYRLGRAIYHATESLERAARSRAFSAFLAASYDADELAMRGTRAAAVRMRKAALAKKLAADARLAAGDDRPTSRQERRVAADGRRAKNARRWGAHTRPVSPWRKRPNTRERLLRLVYALRFGTSIHAPTVGRRCAVDQATTVPDVKNKWKTKHDPSMLVRPTPWAEKKRQDPKTVLAISVDELERAKSLIEHGNGAGAGPGGARARPAASEATSDVWQNPKYDVFFEDLEAPPDRARTPSRAFTPDRASRADDGRARTPMARARTPLNRPITAERPTTAQSRVSFADELERPSTRGWAASCDDRPGTAQSDLADFDRPSTAASSNGDQHPSPTRIRFTDDDRQASAKRMRFTDFDVD